MKTLIIHITDIHTTSKSEYSKYIDSLSKIITSKCNEISKIYFAFTGDIAFSGTSQEYGKFKQFFNLLKRTIHFHLPNIEIRLVIIPGNHDCNFQNEKNIRTSIINQINYEFIGSDDSVAETCLEPQKDFWLFYFELFGEVPPDKLYYVTEDSIENYKVVFHCFNTAWISTKNEKVGQVFLPVRNFPNRNSENALNIALYHHPLNWFNPNTNENNKQEFEEFVDQVASIQLFGHEHEDLIKKVDNISVSSKTNQLSGEVFNENKPLEKNRSGFQILEIDLKEKAGEVFKFHWKEGLYVEESDSIKIDLRLTSKHKNQLKEEFERSLNEIKIPLINSTKKKILLDEIYVWPDLENPSRDEKFLESHVNSLKILGLEENVIINGESQIGKSSLLKMFFKILYSKGKYPILIHGKDLHQNFGDKDIKKVFKSTYSGKNLEVEFSKYLQAPKEDRALLIDDFHECVLGYEKVKEKLKYLSYSFGKVIIVADSTSKVWTNIDVEFDNFRFFVLKQFGHKKRNEIIEKYHRLNPENFASGNYIDTIKESFNNVQNILGDKLMPAYPIYILSILQALQYRPLQGTEVTHAYCYTTLIHYALLNSGVNPDDLDTYVHFLSELAYFFAKNNLEDVESNVLNKFYFEYEDRFIVPPYHDVVATLKTSRILQFESTSVKFGYNYILYFLAAKKISGIIHTEEGQQIVSELFENYHKDRIANILVFITFHSQDITFIENSLFHAMMVLEEKTPVTIEKSDAFYEKISSLVDNLKNEILDVNRSPEEERNRSLEERDRIDDNGKKVDDSEDNIDEVFQPFLKSFRSIEIIGQIVKNRKGSLDKSRLFELVKESYVTGFRTINYLVEVLEREREEIKLVLSNEEKINEKASELIDRINQLIQLFIFRFSFSIITKLAHSVGHKDLKRIYTEVSENINTPVAKLTTFYINSYYNKITEAELKSISKEFSKNHVAMKYLKNIVVRYVYNNELKQSVKQQFASILGISIAPFNRLPTTKK